MREPAAGPHLLRSVPGLLAVTSLIAGGFVLASTLVFICEDHFAGPVKDFWSFVPLLERFAHGEGALAPLVRPHGGHRLLFPHLLYLVEYTLFDGRNVFLVGVGAALQLTLAAILAGAFWVERRRSGAALTGFSLGLVAALLFSATQLENFVRPWNVCWFLTNAAVAVALAAGLRLGDTARNRAAAWRWWLLASAAAWVGSYTMATGLLAWPLLVLLGLVLRWWPRLLWAVGLEGAFAIALFLRGHEALAPGPSHASPAALVQWFLRCLGSPLSWLSPEAGSALALGATFAAAALALRVVARRSAATGAECLLLGLLAFSWGATALIAVGRTARWPELWKEPRYQTIVLLFWLSLILLGLLALRGERPYQRALRASLMLAAVSWLTAVVLPAHLREAESIGRFAARVRAANLALLFGVSHRPDYAYLLSFEDRKLGLDSAANHWSFLSERRLGVFSDPHRDLMGRPLDEISAVADPGRCRGEVMRADLVPTRSGPGLRLSGWAWDVAASRSPSRLLVTGTRRTVVGLAISLRPPLGGWGWSESESPAWRGYALAPRDAFDVWALLESGEVCHVDGAQRPPQPR